MSKPNETPEQREARLAKRREQDRERRARQREARDAAEIWRWLHIENGIPLADGSVWSEEDQEFY